MGTEVLQAGEDEISICNILCENEKIKKSLHVPNLPRVDGKEDKIKGE